MNALKFTLRGKNAFFKKPDVNSYLYFTYGNIHKVALLGILGAILGYSGYNNNKLKDMLENKGKKASNTKIFPEFYERLKELKVSIVPNNNEGFIPKKVQNFNNSVGYASQEQGGNLIVKEQWLENPSWDIYILLQDEEGDKIKDSILNNRAIYLPYLGKNDHYADIVNAEIVEISELDNGSKIDSLCPKSLFQVDIDNDEEEDEEDVKQFKYEESLPIGISEETNMYILEKFLCTNMKIINKDKAEIYKANNRNIVFY
ncbi:type I-B CRISPR-associated protein Cas5b [Clostridium cibarium]|uniref:Type I-B CRISPR-associated protein Cas5 n=1 Tax=Clostridium cibarium TaxID=2762247 RepID=A0ABR8PVV8_9CLOT|nr:type I-B CRISPR-associated protein Cas5b [Clostridium cibarium]MBD7912306.1 type I-B CRISPR-associated protein Cas5 [Clostridium cibarium]